MLRLTSVSALLLILAAAFAFTAHTLLALLLFATILMYLGAALFHAWNRRDRVFHSMVPWR